MSSPWNRGTSLSAVGPHPHGFSLRDSLSLALRSGRWPSVRILVLLCSTLVILLPACNSVTDPTPVPATDDASVSASGDFTTLEGISGKTPKVDVCHMRGNGKTKIINVSQNAVNAHLGHGDHLVTEELCDDGIDNDCDGELDEAGMCQPVVRCPCFTATELDSCQTPAESCSDLLDSVGTLTVLGLCGQTFQVTSETGWCSSGDGVRVPSEEEFDVCASILQNFIASPGTCS